MVLYDTLIDRLKELTENLESAVYLYDENRRWPENENYEMILQKDMSIELGTGGKSAVNYTCVTTRTDDFAEDGIRIFGPDFSDIQMPVNYARVCEVVIKEDKGIESDARRIYKLLQDIDFVKYHIYPKGYMIRTSGQSPREQIRISKKALKDGISFASIGNTYIRHYKKNPAVRRVRVSFFTTDAVDYAELKKSAEAAARIRNSLSDIGKGLPKDCGNCGIKEICADIVGLKELHFGALGENIPDLKTTQE
ncbi:MAG: hypothetical protein IJ899_15185 [Blautia sp.]|nr:hypothetical protein [Blautia sp.]